MELTKNVFGGELIGIAGYRGSGKDTVAKIIKELDNGWVIKQFAAPMKQAAASILGVEVGKLEDRKYKDTVTELGISPRDLIIDMGAKMRKLDPDYWILRLFKSYGQQVTKDMGLFGSMAYTVFPKWVISDVRLESEVEAIRLRGGKILWVQRPGCSSIAGEITESPVSYDYKIINDGDLDKLKEKIVYLFETENVLK